MTEYDAPNQQVVRPDGSAPWEEGNGGSTRPEGKDGKDEPASLEQLTKDELLDLADERGVKADASMKKADIIAALEA